MRAFWTRVRSLWRALRRGDELDAAMHEEMRFHIDMETERLVRDAGLPRDEARRRAHVAFGGVAQFKERGRDVRGVAWIDRVSLDARLAVRMLIKHRGLTLAGGFAIAVTIAIAATFVEVVSEVLNPALPFEDGDRVVALKYIGPDGAERKVLDDFAEWRDQLRSIEHLSAFRTVQHNLVAGTSPPVPVRVAEMTAPGFAVPRVPPLLGRYLLPADERDDAPPVVVVGFAPWRSRFGGDPAIVGRTILLGGVQRTVVGVMPSGFLFPSDHHFWIPLRVQPLEHDRLQGPELSVFGRLAAGATIVTAEAELAAVARRTAAAHPKLYERLRTQIVPYTRERVNLDEEPELVWMLRIAQLLVGGLLFVVAVNLAILTYARTVTRHGEIAVRTALGASRRRILAQLFIEALALSATGAAAGLALSYAVLGLLQTFARFNGTVPFWMRFRLSPATVLYTAVLTLLAAAIMGVLPGLKVTGGRMQASLRELAGSAPRLGRLWTALIVAQIGTAVAVLPASVFLAWQVLQMEIAGPGFPAEHFVVAPTAFGEGAVDAARVRSRQLALMARLQALPGVEAVTFSSSAPGIGPGYEVQLEHDETVRRAPLVANRFDVDVEMFAVYRATLLAGRAFHTGDLGAAHTVVVNRSFVQEILQNRTVLGARFRYNRPQGPSDWYQIVGVVNDFPDFPPTLSMDTRPAVYHAVAPGDIPAYVLTMRFGGPVPEGVIDRVREAGALVDPGLQVRGVRPLSEFYGQIQVFWRFLAWGAGVVTAAVLLLSAAGIYALMSFTVARRTREIGIRVALGAAPHRLLLSIFGRAARQLAIGLVAGSVLSGVVFLKAGVTAPAAAGLLATVAAIMIAVGLMAAAGPARRGLRIQASEALRTD